MNKPVITVDSLSKAYRIGLKEEIPDTLTQAATGWMKAPLKNFNRLRRLNTARSGADEEDDILWALKDVSFDVHEGEVVGIIGRNGAGKSTLLKILSRITEPTSGRAVIRGRVASLLEVGTGFHPELTGRENIYMNGTILGMTKREIDRKFDEIVDFSGVEKFLDTPVKRYSQRHASPPGLRRRRPPGTGDPDHRRSPRRRRCRISEQVSRQDAGRRPWRPHGAFCQPQHGRVKCLCSKGIVLANGSVLFDGAASPAISTYLDDRSLPRIKGDLVQIAKETGLASGAASSGIVWPRW